MTENVLVTTVTGPVPARSLGFCQPHEHIMLRAGQPARLNPALRADETEKSRTEVSDFFRAGGRSLVDAQPVGCGRMPSALAAISQDTGVHIIASTGFHLQRFYPTGHWLRSAPPGRLTELFISELLEGMHENADQSLEGPVVPYRAGLIKTACEAGPLTARSKSLFSAAAQAALLCHVPVMIHTEAGCDPMEVFRLLTAAGVPPKRMIFCHMDRTMPDQKTVFQLCREGAFVEHDTIGRPKYHSDQAELCLILDLLEAGYAGQVMLSLDTTNQRMRSYGGSIGLTYLIGTFLPILAAAGIPQETIRLLTTDNPARALARQVI